MSYIDLNQSLHPSTDLEKFYDRIMQNYPGSVFITDGTGKLVYVTESIEQMLGKKPEWFIGKSTEDIVSAGIVKETSTQEAIASGKTNVKYLKSTSGAIMLIISKPVFDADGNVELIVSYAAHQHEYDKASRFFQKERTKYENVIQYLSEFNDNNKDIVAASDAMRNLLAVTRRIAETNSTVMISGESGTGKEVVAHYIHQCSLRKDKPFIPVNCAAIPAELAESQFFGYEKGAFTGAIKEGKAGLFEFAHKGTLFLDEIGELPLPIQSKLLRVLETGTVSRVGGGEKAKNVDVRIIAATNRDLLQEVRNGNFREDLYYRLNVFPITIAPLRERPEDIEALAYVFLQKYNKQYHTSKAFDPQTLQILKNYRWPGNVRELRNIVERLALLSDKVITPNLLDQSFSAQPSLPSTMSTYAPFYEEGKSLKDRLKDYEKHCIREALAHNQGDVTRTALELEMPVSTLYQKIRTYKIPIK